MSTIYIYYNTHYALHYYYSGYNNFYYKVNVEYNICIYIYLVCDKLH